MILVGITVVWLVLVLPVIGCGKLLNKYMYLRKLNIGITCIAGITYQYVISTCTVNNRFSKQTDELTHRKVKCCGSFWLLVRVVFFFLCQFCWFNNTFFYTVCCWPQFQFTQMMYSKLFINVGCWQLYFVWKLALWKACSKYYTRNNIFVYPY